MSTDKSLAGRRIVVTRTHSQASGLAARLQALGAQVVELPVIRISKDIDKRTFGEAMAELGSYDWIVFTSANGVRHFFEEFFREVRDVRALGLIRIAAVGEGTARGLEDLHLRVECRPAKATSEALAEALVETGSMENAKILVVTGNLNRDALPKRLEEAGAIVDTLRVYRTEETDLSSHPGAKDFRARGAHAVLFASSSAVKAFADHADLLALGPGAVRPLHGSIGPQTSEALKARGLALDFEAPSPGFDELVAALVKHLPPP